MRFDGVLRDDSRGQGLAYVIYTLLTEPSITESGGSPAIQIVLSRTYNDPTPLLLRDASAATAADFLPVPGVALRDDSAPQDAFWHEAAGLYRIGIDPQRTSLTLEEVAALLEPFVPAPEPPLTGAGRAADQPQDVERAWTAAGVVLALSLALGSAALFRRRRGQGWL
jgi:hypothetical protein